MTQLLDGALKRGGFGAVSVIEALTNHDSFTSGPILPDTRNGVYTTRFMNGEAWDTSPWWMQKLVGYTPPTEGSKATVSPEIAWVLGEVPVSRFLNVSRQVYDADDPKGLNYLAIARVVLGAAAYRQDPNTNKYYQNKGRIDRMKNLLARVGTLRTYEGFVDVSTKDQDFRTGGGSRKMRGLTTTSS